MQKWFSTPTSRSPASFLSPASLRPSSWTPPSYVNSNAFREKDFTVGTGEWSLPGTLTLPVRRDPSLARPGAGPRLGAKRSR